ncbi:hypothetical protein Drorol1_Dr00013175 [Drosera rotundifolia]
MRHNATFRRFISALTRGGPGGVPRPIEALASEREQVHAVLDPDALIDTGPTARRFSSSMEIESGKAGSDLTFVLDRIFEGVCRPFKVRVEQVLQSQPSLTVSYKLIIQLEFYSYTTCEQAAEAHKSKGIHSSRRSRVSDSAQLSKSSVDVILANNGTVSSSQSSENPSKIFLINCLCAIQQPLLGHESAAEYAKNLGSMINNHIHALVEKELEAILTRSNLSSKMTHFLDAADHPLAEMEETSPGSLSECLKIFIDTIFGNMNSLPEFEQLQVPKLRYEASTQLARSVAEAYEVIYNAIVDPKNQYPDPTSLARHTSQSIRAILGIESL